MVAPACLTALGFREISVRPVRPDGCCSSRRRGITRLLGTGSFGRQPREQPVLRVGAISAATALIQQLEAIRLGLLHSPIELQRLTRQRNHDLLFH